MWQAIPRCSGGLVWGLVWHQNRHSSSAPCYKPRSQQHWSLVSIVWASRSAEGSQGTELVMGSLLHTLKVKILFASFSVISPAFLHSDTQSTKYWKGWTYSSSLIRDLRIHRRHDIPPPKSSIPCSDANMTKPGAWPLVLIIDHRGTLASGAKTIFSPSWQRSLNICSVKNCLSLLFLNHIVDHQKIKWGAFHMSLTWNIFKICVILNRQA